MNEQPTTGQIMEALLNFQDAVAEAFDRTNVGLRSEIGQLRVEVTTRLDRVERRVTNLETRVDEGFNQIDTRFANLESRRRR